MAESSTLQTKTHDTEVLGSYNIGWKIGQGSYASVRYVEYVDPKSKAHKELACKIFDKKNAPQDFLNRFFPRELDIITKLEHRYLIQIHSILEKGSRIYIFMRYAENGDLLNYMKKNGPLEEALARLWFGQMAEGLSYLHSKQIAHRDLKCENILLTKRGNIRIADFGFARYCVDLETGKRILSETFCGSAAYAAPEVVSGTPYNPKLADIWSLGVILYIMLNAAMPFDDSNLKLLLKDQLSRKWGFSSKIKRVLSQEVKDLLQGMLEPDVTRRITLDMIRTSSWLNHKTSQQSDF